MDCVCKAHLKEECFHKRQFFFSTFLLGSLLLLVFALSTHLLIIHIIISLTLKCKFITYLENFVLSYHTFMVIFRHFRTNYAKTNFSYLINRFIPKSRHYVFCYGTIKIAVTVWGFLHYKKAKINRRSYFQRIFVKFLWCCWSYLSSVYCHCFLFLHSRIKKREEC